MTDGTTGSTAPAPAAADDGLSDDWNDILGDDFADPAGADDEMPETAQAGAPPAAESRESQVGSEGADAAAHAGAPPADAAATKETAPDTAGTTTEDPLAGATPLTYTVDGQERTADGIHRFDDGSAFIDKDFLPTLQQRLSERDHYYEKDRANHERLTALSDSFTKLTAWNAGKDPQGRDRILTGADSIEHQRVLLGRSLASQSAIVDALKDPAVLASLVEAQIGQDGQVYLAPSKQGLDTLWLRADNAAMRAEQQARLAMGSLRSTLSATPSQPTAAPQAPEPTEAQWLQTVDQIVTGQQVRGLTPDDKQFLARLAPKYMRDAKPDEQHLGRRVLDGSFLDVVKDRASLRGQMTTTAQTAPAVAAQNAKRIAAASLGKRPAAPSTPQSSPTTSKRTDADEAWDAKERAAAALFRRRAG